MLHIYHEKVISGCLKILCQSEWLNEKNKNKVFSVDVSLFITDKNYNQIWVIGAVDNITKYFRIDVAFN